MPSMGNPKDQLTNSFENTERSRCVDIVRSADGRFRFQEWRREPEDLAGWFMMFDSHAQTFDTEELAVASARSAIAWFGAND